jgi:UDP-N-acetylglucosamine--N-acetylmuramyl-(pentapeptide) pyrophosphoryl-undecaprenol N-acetylglucosamine transferase
MKYILTGGGTGGHVMPAIAIAQALKKYDKHASFLFIGRVGGRENISVTDNGFSLKTIEVYGIPKSISAKSIKHLIKTVKSIKSAKELLLSFSPDAIIGTGGYVCWPVIRAGANMSIPCFLHESNSVAGRTTRALARHCRAVFTGFPSCEGLSGGEKNKYTGTPVRDEFKSKSKAVSRKKLGIPEQKFFVFSLGGSGGAEKINELMCTLVQKNRNKDLYFIHVAGEKYYKKFGQDIKDCDSFKIIPYAKNIADYISAADLVISRSGALTLSELAYMKKASILIPSPNVKNDHQRKNAMFFKSLGAVQVIDENKLSEKLLTEEILKIKSDREYKNSLEEKISALRVENAGEQIAKSIISKTVSLSATK